MKEFISLVWLGTVHFASLAMTSVGIALQSIGKIYAVYFVRLAMRHDLKYAPKASEAKIGTYVVGASGPEEDPNGYN